jgi:hypothetical protein
MFLNDFASMMMALSLSMIASYLVGIAIICVSDSLLGDNAISNICKAYIKLLSMRIY